MNIDLVVDDVSLKEYIRDLLAALGQMKHVEGKVKCSKEHKDGEEHSSPYLQHKRMSMDTDLRSDLIDRGWKILNELER